MEPPVSVYFNPQCSKSRRARELLDALGVQAELIHYLDSPPSRPELEELLRKLGSANPRLIMREKDASYTDDWLATAEPSELLDALVEVPSLLERPIVVRGDQAIVARPPERLLELWPEPPS